MQNADFRSKKVIEVNRFQGLLIAIFIIFLWTATLLFNFSLEINWKSPLTYLLVLFQTHLFTGLFITAHDGMHGTVVPRNNQVNQIIGTICTTLFIFNSYKKLLPKHHAHHRHVATEEDPDFHNGNPNFLPWFFAFAKEYVTVWQIVLAAIAFNLMGLIVPTENLLLYWVVPSVLSMLQLFYFGTYRPHMGDHEPENVHHAGTQSKNHLWAFLSCYFFGYHYEHHDAPGIPWWRLWKQKV